MRMLIIFIIANIINVVVQTAKSIITIRGNKIQASFANAIAYSIYTYILILMTCELNTFSKCLIVGLCNLIGVFIVKTLEEKKQKEKLWRVEFAAKKENLKEIENQLNTLKKNLNISFNYIPTNNEYYIFSVFVINKQQTKEIKKLINIYHIKYFISENKYNF